jgi:arginine deiminase
MSSQNTKTVVNAWNEWDPLKHVIVGRPEGKCEDYFPKQIPGY